jgi:hypothetical protein
MSLDPRPDAFELTLRYACGGLLGLVMGCGLCISFWPIGAVAALALVAASIATCAVCAAKYGDELWVRLKWWL